MGKKTLTTLLGIGLGSTILVGGVFLLPFSTTTIQSGYVGIKSIFGKYDNEELYSGLHFKIPFIEKIIPVDIKVHTINYKGNLDKPDKEGIINKPAIQVLDKRGLPIWVELSVQYRLTPELTSEFIQKWGFDWEDKLVNPTIREVVRDVIGKYNAEELPTKRPEIATKIEQEIRKRISQLSQVKNKSSIQIIGVQLRNIFLPEEIQKKIKEVQIAKQEAEKMKYVEEKAKREQEIKKIKAETKKLQIVIEAQAKAEANKLISQSITPEILRWKELDVEKTLANSIKENKHSTIFINLPQGSNTNTHLWLNSPFSTNNNVDVDSKNISKSKNNENK